jgi:hypothetical protein
MANYVARVELHDARWPDDYATLHAALAKVGFVNCVRTQAADGTITRKRLPTGTYYSEASESSLINAYSLVQAAATSTKYKHEIFVCESVGFRAGLSRQC